MPLGAGGGNARTGFLLRGDGLGQIGTQVLRGVESVIDAVGNMGQGWGWGQIAGIVPD
jgi:quinol-cytochrome oxidoreductase complex cytochrome b subunit